jgi:mRNA-degrading endonuclease YafQ of YafQ-DinJ toxin-antitoxin module
MKFRRTPKFIRDFRGLTEKQKNAVDNAFIPISYALQGNTELYSRHHIKKMRGHPGIWEGHVESNLCFTFHYDYTDDREKVCFFRRVGTHDIYRNP